MVSQLGQFEAVDTAGTKHTLHVYEHLQEYDPISGNGQLIPLPKSLELDDGTEVLRRSKGVYDIVGGVRLTSDDPNAP